jgi:hypothetical protein|tara:strand:- start:1099 stop:1311 length:213 start_codon:yes stop_codon:yes gene_type:complete
MSKGDKPRPLSISYQQYSDNYEAIFGKKDKQQILYEDFTEEEIEEAEKRIDIIGQNGNDGLHYDEVDGES